MRVSIISFTENGMQLSKRLAKALENMEYELFTKCSAYAGVEEEIFFVAESIGAWTKVQMDRRNALVFIGACGIAVRAIAPYMMDKLQDVPVLVMDEKGQYIIPILSGHMGGANELAVTIAKKTGAEPVITTATDINRKFAVDLFAKRNGLFIVNKDGIAKVSAKVLAGEEITVSVETGHYVGVQGQSKISDRENYIALEAVDVVEQQLPESADMLENQPLEGIDIIEYPPTQPVDVVISSQQREFDTALLLRPKEYIIGIGSRKGKEPEKIEEFITKNLKYAGISTNRIAALASIDAKSREPGLLAWSRKANIPFVTYTAEELSYVKGAFHTSDFVRNTVGVDNVCERAALKGCGSVGKLIYEKHAEDGMTIAIAKREWRVYFDKA